MTKYDIIFEQLQEKVNSGVLTVEDADILNDLAFKRYAHDISEYEPVIESEQDECITYEQYLEYMEAELFGEASKEEVDEYVRKGLKKRHDDSTDVFQFQHMYDIDDGRKVNYQNNKYYKQMTGELPISDKERKKYARYGAKSHTPATAITKKSRVEADYNKSFENLDNEFATKKKTLFNKKRLEREKQEIKNEYINDRMQQMHKIIRDEHRKKNR